MAHHDRESPCVCLVALQPLSSHPDGVAGAWPRAKQHGTKEINNGAVAFLPLNSLHITHFIQFIPWGLAVSDLTPERRTCGLQAFERQRGRGWQREFVKESGRIIKSRFKGIVHPNICQVTPNIIIFSLLWNKMRCLAECPSRSFSNNDSDLYC